MNLQPRRVNFDEVWQNNLKRSVESIVNLQPIQRRVWDNNFSDIYFLCVSIPEPHSKRLYRALRDCLEVHTAGIRKALETLPNDQQLVKSYNAEWKKFHKGAQYLQDLFGYLNKQLKKEQNQEEAQHTFLPMDPVPLPLQTKCVGNLALDTWKSQLIEPLSDQLVGFLVDTLERERRGERVLNSDDVHDVIASFVEVHSFHSWRRELITRVQVNDSFDSESNCVPPSYRSHLSGNVALTEFYLSIFETPLLQVTENYYRSLASEALADLECSAYMERVLQKMAEERARARKFLHPSSLLKIEALLTKYLVQEQLTRFTAVCDQFVKAENVKDLRNMYTLLKPLPSGLSTLVQEFESYIKRCGMDATLAPNGGLDPSQFVANIQTLHEKFGKAVVDVFNGDEIFQCCLDRALQFVVNHREEPKQPPKVSERLNRYIDSLLRKSLKSQNEAELENALSRAVTIFRYIDDKDLFMKINAKMLSNRLISTLSTSMELEEQMITKLKEACGYEFTSKVTRMFTDITLSTQLTEKFNDELAKKKVKLEVPTSFMVLQAGAWPLPCPPQSQSGTSATSGTTSQRMEVEESSYTPPSSLNDSIQRFDDFYAASYNGRRLSWMFGQSSADVKLNYLDKTYIAWMGAYQVSILLTFSDEDSLTVLDAARSSGLDTQTFARNVRGLLDAGILTAKEHHSLVESSILHLNTGFTSRRLRLKIGIPASKPKEEKETDVTCNTLQQDRKYYMECTIVRIMKSRKVMKHAALLDEVIKQTSNRFLPDIAFIKKALESLIEKLYVSRTDELDEYQYLA